MTFGSGALAAAVLAGACATAQKPLQPRALSLQASGVEALAHGQLDRAAGHFALALEFEPRLAEAENGLGLVALRRGDWPRAEERFRAALALNEELAEAHLNLANVLLHRGVEADALIEARAALAVDPGYGDARLLAAELLLRLGRLDDARWELEKLCAAAPERADAHAANALVLARQGRVAAAETEARRALELDGQLPAAHRARDEILRRAGDLEGASRELELVIASNAGAIDDRLAHATIAAARGLWSQADAELAALREAAPNRPEICFAQAFVALAREQSTVALEAADAALALRPRYPEARLVRAEALARLGRDAEMRRELARFLDQAPPAMAAERAQADRALRARKPLVGIQ
jgi:tetratricopeptide (TPR) repeat protein